MLEELPIKCSLTITTIEDTIIRYIARYNCSPTTLLVGLDIVMNAYRVVRDIKTFLVVVPIPGFPELAWMICGPKGCFYTEGI